jgi:hypothetical protein
LACLNRGGEIAREFSLSSVIGLDMLPSVFSFRDNLVVPFVDNFSLRRWLKVLEQFGKIVTARDGVCFDAYKALKKKLAIKGLQYNDWPADIDSCLCIFGEIDVPKDLYGFVKAIGMHKYF